MRIGRDTARGLLGVALAFAIIGFIDQVKPDISSAPDFPCNQGSGNALISIASGESGSSIAASLETAGVVKSSTAFFRVAVGDARSASIAPGTHKIDKGICARDALLQLLDSARITNLLSIPEGAWNREISRCLQRLGFSASDVQSSLRTLTLPEGIHSAEGILFPAQYSFDTSTSLSEIFSALSERGAREMKRAGISTTVNGFSPQELLIIASLVQAEGDTEDYRKISQVVRNRLAIKMPLQFDSTVHYIKGVRGSVFLSTQSTYLNSPYNTYRNLGLPPAPINNPGADAMRAAGDPEAGDWLYFITVSPGDTRFTSSYKQFSEWKVLYKANLRSGKFGD